ncbi:UTP--glucose-1-phosphate uridylyltransferase [Corynebacterium occultum]|uniref:UTP--glucose-1-phosphate uridylyltransferase n=1 Tax=Corynebacterium occultum TaxID=2675219 RepID=A0A6B8W2I1_9CORY|nr:UTP--glucose-1-phosphate uridylyltransferase [Corynebacterium occultum]QGU06227.1 UTP--glucose-1-phosphate uridylyltransferase [Corynebacterium occultum]
MTNYLNTANSAQIKTVVVPAAGHGTRFLPATKTVPKELLPVVDTPGIELIAEEAAELGASRMAIITSPSKPGLLRHFEDFPELVSTLQARGKHEQVAMVERAGRLIEPVSVVQHEALGLGHAVGLAESALDDDEEAFAVMLPDDLVLPFGVLEQMAEVRASFGGSVLCAFEVTPEEVSSYGVFEVMEICPDEGLPTETVKQVIGMVEKPPAAEAPSRLAAAGRYLLDRAVFDALRRIKPGQGGELQLTDAIELMIKEGHPVHVVIHQGKRHDLGNPAGYIPACVDFGLSHPKYGRALRDTIGAVLQEYDDREASLA